MREHERFDWLTECELFLLEMCSNEEGQKEIPKKPKEFESKPKLTATCKAAMSMC